MDISILTPRCTLVPSAFYDPSRIREQLAQVCEPAPDDKVASVRTDAYDAYLVYAAGPDCTRIITDENIPGEAQTLPEMFYILRDLSRCRDYNKILCTWQEGYLYMAIAQGGTLLLANVYEAPDFTTAQYYIFLAVKSLQINPEVSTVCWRIPVGAEEKMSLYRYFKSVEKL